MSLGRDRFTGKFALVTGGSRGIGRAVAEQFAREGGTVALNHFNDQAEADIALAHLVRLSESAGHGAKDHRIAPCDIAKVDEVKGMIVGLVSGWGRLDILVNNAGIQASTPGDGFDASTFERIVAVNVMGQAYCAEYAIAHFLTRPGGGSIVNTTSVHEIVPKPGFLAYSVSKGALGNLTRTLALEFSDRGIRVNAVGPGAVLTSMNDAWRNDSAAKKAVESHIPMGRAASPEEIAMVFAFLASDDAAYVTGQTLFACGGITLYGDFKNNWAS